MEHEKIFGIRKSLWILILFSTFIGYSISTCGYKYYFFADDSGNGLELCKEGVFYGQVVLISLGLFVFGIIAHYIMKFNEEEQ